MDSQMKKDNKLNEPTDKEYKHAKYQLALSALPTIWPCDHCKWPVIRGYCCTYCESSNP